MEKDRKIKTVAVAAVLVAIIGLSIAFAALSQTLTINGTAKADKSTWQVVWEKISGENFVTTGTAEVQTGFPKLDNDTSKTTGVDLSLGTITLKKPGDKVTYRVNMANNGDIDAKVMGVTGVNVNNTYVDYSVKYLDNNTDITQANGRLLAAGTKKLVLIEVKFKEDVTAEQFNAIPSEGITVDFNQVSISYTQDDGTGESDPEPVVEKRYNISVKDLTNIDLSKYNLADGSQVAYGFEDINGVIHAFAIGYESSENNYINYNPDINGSIVYFYDSNNNNWYEFDLSREGEGQDSSVTGVTMNTNELVFNNVRLVTDEEYESNGLPKFTDQMINDILNITEVE